jgi:hypothetical protein
LRKALGAARVGAIEDEMETSSFKLLLPINLFLWSPPLLFYIGIVNYIKSAEMTIIEDNLGRKNGKWCKPYVNRLCWRKGFFYIMQKAIVILLLLQPNVLNFDPHSIGMKPSVTIIKTFAVILFSTTVCLQHLHLFHISIHFHFLLFSFIYKCDRMENFHPFLSSADYWLCLWCNITMDVMS